MTKEEMNTQIRDLHSEYWTKKMELTNQLHQLEDQYFKDKQTIINNFYNQQNTNNEQTTTIGH